MLALREAHNCPIISYLFSERFHGGDVDAATFSVVQQHPQNSKLCTDGLSTAGGSSHKHIVITVVHSIEHWRDRHIQLSHKNSKMDSEPLSIPRESLSSNEMIEMNYQVHRKDVSFS